jgi:pantothenate kinase
MLSVEAAVDRARALATRPGIAILGITGPPGAGKSTLAAAVVTAVPGTVLVGMDGFHLAHSALEALRRVERKGAPDTFDAQGYVALLHRIRGLGEPAPPLGADAPGGADRTVWAPQFRREMEDAVAGAVPIGEGTQLVVTEGNYLLLDRPPWDEVRPFLDECWYVDLPDEVRRTRLQARHERYGRSAEEAHARTWGSDERNAVLVAASRDRSDLRVSGSRLAPRSLD